MGKEKRDKSPQTAPSGPDKRWWEEIANAHALRDREAGRVVGRCSCMGCHKARQEGFRTN
jgi:mono/diheme cytochrome c family protein